MCALPRPVESYVSDSRNICEGLNLLNNFRSNLVTTILTLIFLPREGKFSQPRHDRELCFIVGSCCLLGILPTLEYRMFVLLCVGRN